jgi:hypothetical protein
MSLEPSPRLGHNNPPQPVGSIDLELGCARVPNPLETEEDAAAATDFIAQCQSHIKKAEVAHKKEKAYFLEGGRIVDVFFKRRCAKLTDALGAVGKSLKAYYDRIAETEAERHEETRRAAEAAAQRAAEEESQCRAEANRLALSAPSSAERYLAAEQLLLADAAAKRAALARQVAAAKLEPTRIGGDYGSTAYVRKVWTFELVDLAQVPREYLSLDVEAVREAINKDAVRQIPGLRIYQSESLHVRGAA